MHKYKTKHVNYKTYVPVNNNKISDLIMRLFTTVCILSTQATQIHGIHPARLSAPRVDPPALYSSSRRIVYRLPEGANFLNVDSGGEVWWRGLSSFTIESLASFGIWSLGWPSSKAYKDSFKCKK